MRIFGGWPKRASNRHPSNGRRELRAHPWPRHERRSALRVPGQRSASATSVRVDDGLDSRDSGGHRGARILAFRPAPNAVPCVLLSFERRGDRWYCDFYEGSGTAKVRKTLCYGSSDKVVSLAVKGGAFARPNTRCNLFATIEVGRGRILLNLTSDQYKKLIAA